MSSPLTPDSIPNTTRRDPVRTRERLLTAGFEEIYRLGFQGSDLNSILGRAGVTKGALYHHFDNKEALGHAIIEDVVGAITDGKWLAPLRCTNDPIAALIAIVEGTVTTDDAVAGGCPLNNLAQEMSGVDEGVRTRVAGLFTRWIDGVADALARGQAAGTVRGDIDAREAGQFMVAAYEGYFS
ncbi:MAG: TetR/AcrR family transcriptional regulator, partial [Asticcacaulis sp.]|nr:TetR/AcrR family transcriptional regulator [Asticcacaulis sp.]